MMIALNASTVTAEELDAMKAEGLVLEHVEAWHNFYPRPETGLKWNWFNDKNRGFIDKESVFRRSSRETGDYAVRCTKRYRRSRITADNHRLPVIWSL